MPLRLATVPHSPLTLLASASSHLCDSTPFLHTANSSLSPSPSSSSSSSSTFLFRPFLAILAVPVLWFLQLHRRSHRSSHFADLSSLLNCLHCRCSFDKYQSSVDWMNCCDCDVAAGVGGVDDGGGGFGFDGCCLCWYCCYSDCCCCLRCFVRCFLDWTATATKESTPLLHTRQLLPEAVGLPIDSCTKLFVSTLPKHSPAINTLFNLLNLPLAHCLSITITIITSYTSLAVYSPRFYRQRSLLSQTIKMIF